MTSHDVQCPEGHLLRVEHDVRPMPARGAGRPVRVICTVCNTEFDVRMPTNVDRATIRVRGR
jgi:hypothetical protein